MRTNYVLIDYENVQPSSLAGLDTEHFRVLVFVGASQNKLNFDTAAAMQKLGPRGEYVKIAGNGSNALDFHIAFHIGHLAAQDPTAFFHIISRDTGFDPLIQHLKERRLFASRLKDVSDLPVLKAVEAKSIDQKIDVVLANLQQRVHPSRERSRPWQVPSIPYFRSKCQRQNWPPSSKNFRPVAWSWSMKPR